MYEGLISVHQHVDKMPNHLINEMFDGLGPGPKPFE